MHFAFLLASMAYILVSIHIGWALAQDKPIHKSLSLGLLLIGMAAHAALLYPYVVTLYGLNFNLFNIISLTSLFFLFFYLLFCLYRPILSLGILAAPTALIGMTIGYVGRAPYQPLTDVSIGLEIHIILSLAAYCVLLMAAGQALFFSVKKNFFSIQPTIKTKPCGENLEADGTKEGNLELRI